MTNPFSQIGLGVLANTAHNQYYAQQQAYNPQQQYAAQQAFNMYAQQQVERREWMINGKPMTMKEFADTLWPEDHPDKTLFYLKYSK